MDDTYRSPNTLEQALLTKLLERNFPGHDRLREQLDDLSVKMIDKEGSLSMKVSLLAAPAEVKERVVAEGYCSDEDESSSEGPQVHVLLHVVKGLLHQIEIYKDDGSPIKRGARAENLTLD